MVWYVCMYYIVCMYVQSWCSKLKGSTTRVLEYVHVYSEYYCNGRTLVFALSLSINIFFRCCANSALSFHLLILHNSAKSSPQSLQELRPTPVAWPPVYRIHAHTARRALRCWHPVQEPKTAAARRPSRRRRNANGVRRWGVANGGGEVSGRRHGRRMQCNKAIRRDRLCRRCFLFCAVVVVCVCSARSFAVAVCSCGFGFVPRVWPVAAQLHLVHHGRLPQGLKCYREDKVRSWRQFVCECFRSSFVGGGVFQQQLLVRGMSELGGS